MALPRPLTGVRVLDFTWVRAGPWTTRWLGSFGAEVIKVEWPQNLDSFRRNRTTVPAGVEPGPNSPGLFAETNANKISVTLNMRSPHGMELLQELIAISDVVIENFSSRVMQRRGLFRHVAAPAQPEPADLLNGGLNGRDEATHGRARLVRRGRHRHAVGDHNQSWRHRGVPRPSAPYRTERRPEPPARGRRSRRRRRSRGRSSWLDGAGEQRLAGAGAPTSSTP